MSLFNLFRRKKAPEHFAVLPADYPAELPQSNLSPEAYFGGIFRAAFPGFAVEENVSAKDLFGDIPDARGCQNLSFVLRRKDQPVLAVILCPSGEGNTPAILNAMAACQEAGLPCHRYFTDWRNRSSFVTERTREVLEQALAQNAENKG